MTKHPIPARLNGRIVLARIGDGAEMAHDARVRVVDAIAELEAPLTAPWRWLPERMSVKRVITADDRDVAIRTSSGFAVHSAKWKSDDRQRSSTLSVPSQPGRAIVMHSQTDPDDARIAAYSPCVAVARAVALRTARTYLAALDAALDGPAIASVLPGVTARNVGWDMTGVHEMRLSSPFMRPRACKSLMDAVISIGQTTDDSDDIPLCVHVTIARDADALNIWLWPIIVRPCEDVVETMRSLERLNDLIAGVV